jgi:hypothetical protein
MQHLSVFSSFWPEVSRLERYDQSFVSNRAFYFLEHTMDLADDVVVLRNDIGRM